MIESIEGPGLFGQKHSNRDYSKRDSWGKNQFNSSFPASLVAYMSSRNIDLVYLRLDKKGDIVHDTISGTELFGMDPLSDDLYYGFESTFLPYDKYYTGKKERIDLVLSNNKTDAPLKGLEIKLTALPDNTTRNLSEDKYGCEIVVRPPTICFAVCAICKQYNDEKGKNHLRSLLSGVPNIIHWEMIDEVAPHYVEIQNAVLRVINDASTNQVPLILQPVWKTNGKTLRLSDDCLDAFVWSNLALTKAVVDDDFPTHDITRFQRTIVWIYKMLFDYVTFGQFDYVTIIKNQSYGTANDKAFSIPGSRSYGIMKCKELIHPRIGKSEIRKIILGGGQNYLSPERRFDAMIVNTPDLFL